MKSYAENQKSFRVKVGDIVKIFRKPNEGEYRIWFHEQMDCMVGSRGKVRRIYDNGIYVEVTDHPGPKFQDGWWILPYTCLEILR